MKQYRMNMKRKSVLLVVLALSFFILPDLNAQYGKKKKRRDKDEEVETRSRINSAQFFEKVWVGANINSPSINSFFINIGAGPMAAYKFNRFLSAGIITNINYQYYWAQGGQSQTYIDYSAGVFGRARFLQQFYAHAEYNFTSLEIPTSTITSTRENFPLMLLGGGYTSGRPPWGFEATLLVDVSGNLAEYRLPFIYRLGVTYAF